MEKLRYEHRIPSSAVEQLRRLCDLLRKSHPSLAGVILHGSAATSSFEPGRSDLDVLAIVNTDPGHDALACIGQGILAISDDPHPLEFSIISSKSLLNWQHPCPHLLHFGEEKRSAYEAGLFAPATPTDEDLTMHLMVARERGIDLLGTYPELNLPEIPRIDYLSAILSDFRWAMRQDESLSDYAISNASGTLAYLRDGVILSKSEGRQWCADRGIDTAELVAIVMEELQREIRAIPVLAEGSELSEVQRRLGALHRKRSH